MLTESVVGRITVFFVALKFVTVGYYVISSIIYG